MTARRFALTLVLAAPACALPVNAIHEPSSLILRDTEGAPHPLDAVLHAHRFTAIVFFSSHCPCMTAHDARLRDLIAREAGRDVGVLVVASEEAASVDADATESRARGYAILLDDDAKLARAVDAEYATYSVVLDAEGRVLYRGGFDSERVRLTAGSTRYLAEALDDVDAGRPVRHPVTHALGCTLDLR